MLPLDFGVSRFGIIKGRVEISNQTEHYKDVRFLHCEPSYANISFAFGFTLSFSRVVMDESREAHLSLREFYRLQLIKSNRSS
jgi:hypothetical protein